ncbi:MAG TPA: SIMPL domain-containing protein [bacterium]
MKFKFKSLRWIGVMLPILILWAAFASAQDVNSKERTVRVQGQGKATAIPDQAELQFEVRAEGIRLENVTAEARTRMKDVFKAIKSFGVSDKDFQTVNYTIQPKYKYDKNGNENKQVGYIVSNRIRVVLKDVDLSGKVLEAVTEAGISQVEGPTFGFSDPAKLEIEALKAAVEDAHGKAQALAQTAGADLGKVFSIVQSGSGMPEPRPMIAMAMSNNARAEVPIAKGQDEVAANVEVVYLLK